MGIRTRVSMLCGKKPPACNACSLQLPALATVDTKTLRHATFATLRRFKVAYIPSFKTHLKSHAQIRQIKAPGPKMSSQLGVTSSKRLCDLDTKAATGIGNAINVFDFANVSTDPSHFKRNALLVELSHHLYFCDGAHAIIQVFGGRCKGKIAPVTSK